MTRRYFGHAHIRTMISTFGKLFSNFYSADFNSSGTAMERLRRVPIRYLPADAAIASQDREKDDQDLNKFYEIYPRMAFEFTGLSYDIANQLPKSHVHKNPNRGSQYWFSPAPYIMNFTVTLVARNQITAVEVLEQILPWYRPDLNVSIKHEAFDGETRDVQVKLISVDLEDNYADKNARFVVYTLQFEAKTSLWGPVAGADIEIAKFVECGGTVIKDQLDGTNDDGSDDDDDVTVVTTPTGQIHKIIVDWMMYDTKLTDDPFFPVIERDIITPEPASATSQETMTGINVEVDTDVTLSERRP